MMCSLPKGYEIKSTDKALYLPIKNEGEVKYAWFPKSQIEIGTKTDLFDTDSIRMVDIQDWLWEKVINELFY